MAQTRTSILFLFAGLAGLAGLVAAHAAPDYDRQILPILEEYCYDCHGEGADKGGVSLDPNETGGPKLLKDRGLWKLVRHNLVQKVMPPENKAPLSKADRELLVRWIDESVFHVDCNKPQPGRVTLRRLNRVEYNNTVRDLLGVNFRPADDFPPDDTGYGYDNIGDVLSMSPILLEKYTKAAATVMDQFGQHGRMMVLKPDELQAKDRNRNRWVSSMRNEHHIKARFPATRAGRHTLRVLTHADQAKAERTRIGVRLDDKLVGERDVTGTEKKPQWRSFELMLPGGSTELALHITNNFVDNKRKRGDHDRNIHVHRVELHPPSVGGSQIVPARDMKGGGLVGERARASASQGSWLHADFLTEEAGKHTLRVLASAEQAGGETARVGAQWDWSKPLGSRDVKARFREDEPQWVEFAVELPAGREVGFQFNIANDFYDPKRPRGDRDRNIYVHQVQLVPPSGPDPRGTPLPLACDGDPRACAERALRPFMRRAFRRPPNAVEVMRHVEFHQRLMKDGESYQDALKVVAQAVLVSPHFLFRGDERAGLVDEHYLAERLSYFLWSTMPDEELFELAAAGQLRARLDAQIERMLRDPKADALEKHFAGQWLQLRNLEIVTPDPKTFPAWNKGLRDSMRRETELLFRHIREHNRPVLELIDAKYSYIDRRLAKHYGIPGFEKKNGFEYIEMHDGRRGGILTHAGILTLTSYPTRTSPVLRGAWVMETLLGTPPPPPPEDIPELEEASEDGTATLRESLEAHREKKICASCHNRIDPIGFGLENFDGIGAWRDQDNGKPIDPSGRLVGGQAFQGHTELRHVLASEKRDQFTRCLVENMLTYALGRGLDVEDVCAVDKICRELKAGEYRFRTLVKSVVRSVPFQQQASSK